MNATLNSLRLCLSACLTAVLLSSHAAAGEGGRNAAADKKKKLKVVVFYSKEDRHWAAVNKYLDQVAKRHQAAVFRRVCIDAVEGMDQAGIVYKISQFLADNAVNILDLTSKVIAAPGSGTPLYIMDIEIQMPAGMTIDKLEEGLSAVADELHVDISL